MVIYTEGAEHKVVVEAAGYEKLEKSIKIPFLKEFMEKEKDI